MGGVIYGVGEDNKLVRMEETLYETEDIFQSLLESYPDLLAGDQISQDAPRRWVLVGREFGVPGEEGGIGQWSLDHLFLDQDGIPTMVEVKRSSDTRIRREVVGQMLDYAANGVAYWPMEKLRAHFEARCNAEGVTPSEKLLECFGGEVDEEEFWGKVKTNLGAGRVRMLFVADQIPNELRRIVEFLNEQMDPAEVLAVEIKQYVGKGQKTLVPRVIGQTAEAERKKSVGSTKQWDEATFFEALAQHCGKAEVEVARKILEWVNASFSSIWWGKGKKDGSFVPLLDHQGDLHYLISVWTYGRIEIGFQYMKTRVPFIDENKRRELLDRLNAIPGVSIPQEAISKRPSIQLSTLCHADHLDSFLAAMNWAITAVKAPSVSS